jgi:hypothetical protein
MANFRRHGDPFKPHSGISRPTIAEPAWLFEILHHLGFDGY